MNSTSLDSVIKSQEKREYSIDYVWKRDCLEEKGKGTELQRATWGSECRDVYHAVFLHSQSSVIKFIPKDFS